MKHIIIFLIKLYKNIISPFLPTSCRFYPSCSTYCITAIDRFGVFKGGLISLKRLLRCHPLNQGGFDPVPDKE
jgi:putative membrane protein insertion efficiency factor